jgi:hypothetical protein
MDQPLTGRARAALRRMIGGNHKKTSNGPWVRERLCRQITFNDFPVSGGGAPAGMRYSFIQRVLLAGLHFGVWWHERSLSLLWHDEASRVRRGQAGPWWMPRGRAL